MKGYELIHDGTLCAPLGFTAVSEMLDCGDAPECGAFLLESNSPCTVLLMQCSGDTHMINSETARNNKFVYTMMLTINLDINKDLGQSIISAVERQRKLPAQSTIVLSIGDQSKLTASLLPTIPTLVERLCYEMEDEDCESYPLPYFKEAAVFVHDNGNFYVVALAKYTAGGVGYILTTDAMVDKNMLKELITPMGITTFTGFCNGSSDVTINANNVGMFTEILTVLHAELA